MIPLELILSKIPDFEKCRAAGAAENPPLGRGGKERGFRGKEFPPRPRFRCRKFLSFILTKYL